MNGAEQLTVLDAPVFVEDRGAGPQVHPMPEYGGGHRGAGSAPLPVDAFLSPSHEDGIG